MSRLNTTSILKRPNNKGRAPEDQERNEIVIEDDDDDEEPQELQNRGGRGANAAAPRKVRFELKFNEMMCKFYIRDSISSYDVIEKRAELIFFFMQKSTTVSRLSNNARNDVGDDMDDSDDIGDEELPQKLQCLNGRKAIAPRKSVAPRKVGLKVKIIKDENIISLTLNDWK